MLKKNCPCDIDGICPYDSEHDYTCEYWCGDDPEWDVADYETGFDPYMGCYTDDC